MTADVKLRTLSTDQSEYTYNKLQVENLHFYKKLNNSFNFLSHLKINSCALHFDSFDATILAI